MKYLIRKIKTEIIFKVRKKKNGYSWNLNKLKDYETRNNGHQINKRSKEVSEKHNNTTFYLEFLI